jgi:hypothetical protein
MAFFTAIGVLIAGKAAIDAPRHQGKLRHACKPAQL